MEQESESRKETCEEAISEEVVENLGEGDGLEASRGENISKSMSSAKERLPKQDMDKGLWI